MIPLQTTVPVRKFPVGTAAVCTGLLLLEIVSIAWPGPREIFLEAVAWRPSQGWGPSIVLALLFFPNVFAFLIQTLFVWVFTPRLFERRGGVFVGLCSVGGVFASLGFFSFIFPSASVPMLVPEALIGSWLGAYMRRDIWGTVNTLVPGPGWLRVLEVPSYVQLFFWFFYQLLANLFLPEVLGNAPMPYAIGLTAFLWGFLFDGAWGAFVADRGATARN